MSEISRRKHGCDCCHESSMVFGKDVIKDGRPTEMFLGYCGNVLWICDECYEGMSSKIPRFHRNRNIYVKRLYKVRRK